MLMVIVAEKLLEKIAVEQLLIFLLFVVVALSLVGTADTSSSMPDDVASRQIAAAVRAADEVRPPKEP